VEYTLKVAENDVHLNADLGEDSSLKVTMGEKTYDVKYNVISEHQIHMTVNSGKDSRQVNAYVANSSQGKTVSLNGRLYGVSDLEKQRQRVKNGGAPDLPDSITPPTPAVVVGIFVKVGDPVKKGQNVIVVSAMKMETTLCAPFDGTVAKINTAVGDKVAPGQVLVEIEDIE
jgi:biotin carboxyl carrier protein